MAEIGVVHLVRRKNGLAPFERFLSSYSQYPAGVPHDLVLVFKGFPGRGGLNGYDRVLSDVPHRRLFVPDRGLDLSTYFAAAEEMDYANYCFLNSYSRILCPYWLAGLHRWISADDVGLAGATGSYQSNVGGYTELQRRIKALPPAQKLYERINQALADKRRGLLLQRVIFRILRIVGIWRPDRDFPPYPNYHIRTNTFMIARQTLRRVRVGRISTKHTAYKFESGNDSLTNQVRRLGLRVMVVGCNGEGYEPERWHLSNTFWQSAQQNLLVADNQTEYYSSSDPATRSELSQIAWGDFARPA